jgi:hypothetical protein
LFGRRRCKGEEQRQNTKDNTPHGEPRKV